MQQIVPEKLHTLRPAMPIKHSEQTDEFPFATPDILLNQQAILHLCSCPSVHDLTCVEPIELKHQAAKLQLAVKRQGMGLVRDNAGKNLIDGYQSTFADFRETVLWSEYELGIVTEMETLPADFYLEVLVWLVLYFGDHSFVGLTLLKPFLTVITYAYNFLYLLFLEGKSLESCVLCGVQLRQSVYTIVFEDIAQIVHVVNHAYLLNLIDFVSVSEIHYVWTN